MLTEYHKDVVFLYQTGKWINPAFPLADVVARIDADDFICDPQAADLVLALRDYANRNESKTIASCHDELVRWFDSARGGWASDLHALISIACLEEGYPGHLSAACGHAWRILAAHPGGSLWSYATGLALLDCQLEPFETDQADVVSWKAVTRRGASMLMRRRGDDESAPTVQTGPGIVVVRSLPETGREIATLKREFDKHVGKTIALRETPDVAAAAAALTSEAPHQAAAIDALLRSTAVSRTVRLRPTILVGEPGAGKTRLARRVAEVLGVPAVVYPAGGVADASLSGTSRQWGTGRPSVPLQAILRHGVANPVIVVDEVEKASQDNRNGSLVDALLGMLEPGTAQAHLDPYLETETDLSAVSWILTANDEAKIPAPLRDRCRIIWVPEPDVRHAPALVRSVLAEIARDRDLEDVWVPELTPADVALIARAWGGGSVRKLRRCVETWVDAHDAPRFAH